MIRRTFLAGIAAAAVPILAGQAAFAATFADDVISQLTNQGFHNISVQTTWLGRMRITGDRADGQRELILNPRTGEVLRDTWRAAGLDTAKPIIDDIDDATSANSGGNDGNSGSDGVESGDGNGSGGASSAGDDRPDTETEDRPDTETEDKPENEPADKPENKHNDKPD